MRCTACLLLLLGVAAPAAEESLDLRVNRAIDRAAASLVRRQATDGSWQRDDKVHPLGRTALCAYALLHAGHPRDHPALASALRFLRLDDPGYFSELEVRSTYETGCLLLLLHALGSAYDGHIQRLCAWLVEHFNQSARLWGYPDGTPDLSNTQYAVFGLKVGEMHGFRVPKDLWRALVKGVLRLQARDGAFRYRTGELYRASMTHAALLVLRFAGEALGWRQPPRDVREAMEGAQAWLVEHYRIDTHPFGRGTHTANYYYYLYGLERYAEFFGLERIGEHDWYREGAEELLLRQKDDGSWGNLEDTSFAILFLRRVTLTAPRAREVGDAEDQPPSARPDRPAELRPADGVAFLRQWLLAGPFPAVLREDDMLIREDFPLERPLPAPGRRAGRKKWFVHESAADEVNLKDACGGGEWCNFYAALYLHCEQPGQALLWLGTEDGCKVFLNGVEVLEGHHHGYCGNDFYRVALDLQAGRNLLVVKVENTIYYCKLKARLTGPDGAACAGVTPALSPRAD